MIEAPLKGYALLNIRGLWARWWISIRARTVGNCGDWLSRAYGFRRERIAKRPLILILACLQVVQNWQWSASNQSASRLTVLNQTYDNNQDYLERKIIKIIMISVLLPLWWWLRHHIVTGALYLSVSNLPSSDLIRSEWGGFNCHINSIR